LHPLAEVGLSDELIWGLVDAAPDGIVMTDEAGRILLVNRQVELLFGYERSELLGRPVEDLLPEQFRQVHRAHRTHYRAEPRTRVMGGNLQLVAERNDGSEFPVEVSLSPLQSESGLLVVAAVRDVTDRRAAEAEIRRVHELLDATRDGMFIFESETLQFSYVNQGAVEQVGYPRDELLTMTPLHIAPNFNEIELRERLAPLEAGRASSAMFNMVHRRRDGVDIPVEVLVQASPASGNTGRRSYVALVRDISDRVEAEEQLRVAAQELRLVEDRERIGRDLHDTVVQRLFAAGMSLQAASSLVAHDRDASRRINSVVDELDATIREIRTAIYGLQPESARRAGLRSAVMQVVEAQRSALGLEPRIRFEGVLDVVADDLAEQLLATLREALSNVARHAAATTVEVSIEAGAQVVLQVIDNGDGIPATPSTGHGLANMAARAEQLGGTFTTSPVDSGGTVITWSVPNRSS
jgi:PAS domain S-box-containing protein